MTSSPMNARPFARVLSAAAALVLTAGVVLGTAGAASAATVNQTVNISGFATKANCVYAQGQWSGHIVRKGGTIRAGDVCAWRGAKDKWGFTIVYRP